MRPNDLDRWHDDGGGHVPDRDPETRAPTVADEIPRANVVRLERDTVNCRLWSATIGPDARSGLRAFGHTPRQAIVHLMIRCESLGWCFDDSWHEPRPGAAPLVREGREDV